MRELLQRDAPVQQPPVVSGSRQPCAAVRAGDRGRLGVDQAVVLIADRAGERAGDRHGDREREPCDPGPAIASQHGGQASARPPRGHLQQAAAHRCREQGGDHDDDGDAMPLGGCGGGRRVLGRQQVCRIGRERRQRDRRSGREQAVGQCPRAAGDDERDQSHHRGEDGPARVGQQHRRGQDRQRGSREDAPDRMLAFVRGQREGEHQPQRGEQPEAVPVRQGIAQALVGDRRGELPHVRQQSSDQAAEAHDEGGGRDPPDDPPQPLVRPAPGAHEDEEEGVQQHAVVLDRRTRRGVGPRPGEQRPQRQQRQQHRSREVRPAEPGEGPAAHHGAHGEHDGDGHRCDRRGTREVAARAEAEDDGEQRGDQRERRVGRASPV